MRNYIIVLVIGCVSATGNVHAQELPAKYVQIAAVLDTIFNDDQYYREKGEEIAQKYGYGSEQMNENDRIINHKDSINIIRVKEILDKYGWLGPDKVGKRGNNALFYVIQHASHETQVQYLPMMRKAVADNAADGYSLAMLEDRVALGEGKKQIYGSQVMKIGSGDFYLRPMIDPDNVDKRRASVGLEPIAEYLANWNIKWDVEAYKRQLPETEKSEKQLGLK